MVAIGLADRKKIIIEAGKINIACVSGLIKIAYDSATNNGEMIVKSGLFEVFSRMEPDMITRVSGFYKCSFTSQKISIPVPLSNSK